MLKVKQLCFNYSVSKIFRRIQTSSPVLSNEEREWANELKLMQDKTVKLKRSSQIVSVFDRGLEILSGA